MAVSGMASQPRQQPTLLSQKHHEEEPNISFQYVCQAVVEYILKLNRSFSQLVYDQICYGGGGGRGGGWGGGKQ